MNVKPGDFAHVVGGTRGNEGKTCYVEGPGGWDRDHEAPGKCYYWIVILLSPATVYEGGDTFLRYEVGARVLGKDKKLRRIDPPEGVEELFRSRVLEVVR